MNTRRQPARESYCRHCGGLQGFWEHRRSDCLYELRARMRYLLAQNELHPASPEAAERERALGQLEERIEQLLAGRFAYAAEYPLPFAA